MSANDQKELPSKQTTDMDFTMHPHLIYQTIHNQAGSFGKAILEGVQNAVDAEATRIDITISNTAYTIKDDGVGFSSREEIEEMFGRFGTPHESGDARFGRFRIGRGQLFSYSQTTWKSNQFIMNVDIKNNGLKYELIESNSMVPGCLIEGYLYKELITGELARTVKEITQSILFLDIPVYLNNDLISSNPHEQEWTFQDEYAFYRFTDKEGALNIYNMGVFTVTKYASEYGIGGDIVSKKALELNQARSSILSDRCETWAQIVPVIRKYALSFAKNTRQNSNQREAMISSFLSREITLLDFYDMPVFTQSNKKRISLKHIVTQHLPIAFRGNASRQIAERIIKDGAAIILEKDGIPFPLWKSIEDTVEALHDASFAALLTDQKNSLYQYVVGSLRHIPCIHMDELNQERETHERIETKKLTKEQRVIRNAIQAASPHVAWITKQPSRKIFLGNSNVADAWTDGYSRITFDIKVAVKIAKNGYAGCTTIAGMLIHEYLHDFSDEETHVHDEDFYETYHEHSIRGLQGEVAAIIEKAFVNGSHKNDLKIHPEYKKAAGRILKSGKSGRTIVLTIDQGTYDRMQVASAFAHIPSTAVAENIAKHLINEAIKVKIPQLECEEIVVEDPYLYFHARCTSCQGLIRGAAHVLYLKKGPIFAHCKDCKKSYEIPLEQASIDEIKETLGIV